ncbi:MAG: cation:proton antiporter [Kiritimatiellae bacterium]|nr:cation:proton antiporter [Kiritimatiellia bacterium]
MRKKVSKSKLRWLNLCLLGAGIFLGCAVSNLAETNHQAHAQEVHSQESAPSHGGGVANVLLAISLILIVAKLGGHFFEYLHMPAVLGELVGGVLVGNLWLIGFDTFEFVKHIPSIEILAEIGVIFLLFEVGLESKISDLLKVGVSSLLVAFAGIIVPFFLGAFVSHFFMPEAHIMAHMFIGATLCATSVGITARVLKDIKKIDTNEARIILGAAVIDDVLGLIILAIITGAISAIESGAGGGISGLDIMIIMGKAILFFVGAILLGHFFSPKLFKVASRLRGSGLLLTTAVTFCFLLSYLAAVIGLAPIVGAFCAGLILEDVHYKEFRAQGEKTIEVFIQPIAYFLVPVFFVLMGIRVDLSSFANVEILGFSAVLTIAAIIGKQICSLGVIQKGVNRLAIGIGMIPRGEVGLIFAGISSTLVIAGKPVINSSVYAAVVIMVIITTLFTPPLLKWVLLRKETPV